MAQPSNYCNEHSVAITTTSCVGHRAACPTNRAVSLDAGFGVSGNKIYASDIETLRQKIKLEIDAYNTWRASNTTVGDKTYASISYTDPGVIDNTKVIDNSHVNNLEKMMEDLSEYLFPKGKSYADRNDQLANHAGNTQNSYADSTEVSHTHFSTLLTKYNTIRQDCICNSDCACNNVCSCHNDCGCNY